GRAANDGRTEPSRRGGRHRRAGKRGLDVRLEPAARRRDAEAAMDTRARLAGRPAAGRPPLRRLRALARAPSVLAGRIVVAGCRKLLAGNRLRVAWRTGDRTAATQRAGARGRG